MSYPNTIRVFEYQRVKVGEVIDGQCFKAEHLFALAQYYEHQKVKYYNLVHQGVQFSHYVGALQIGNLTIEILPKADNIANNHDHWQQILLDLLRACRLLKVEALTSAPLRLKSNSILDLYFEIFLNEVEALLRKGLCKSYNLRQGNSGVWKGQLLFQEHLKKNQIHKERFYTRHETYDYDHLVNQILYKALKNLRQLLWVPSLKNKLNKILESFPKVADKTIDERHFEAVFDNRKHLPYKKALEIARLLILQFSPDIRSGRHHLLAILFDMNKLFEEYVYQQLRREANTTFTVSRQESRSFWNRRYIQPDIIIQRGKQKYVLDTKWKMLKSINPSMEDLRQAYVYGRFFKADKAILIYPKVYPVTPLPAIPFDELEECDPLFCEVKFIEIVKNGRLNRNLAKEIISDLSQHLSSKSST